MQVLFCGFLKKRLAPPQGGKKGKEKEKEDDAIESIYFRQITAGIKP